jgi:hypothetical protein
VTGCASEKNRPKCEKIAQNDAQAVFSHNKNVPFVVEISSPIIWAISVTCKKLPEVNSHPIGENSPNLVTLVQPYTF